ncbi:hypothetical protein AB0N89_09075 [Amycolatopsis sp. NPDC089917]|uniref:hypothetical protein n=1 Tax=Amycolatopsis sp. NPDC089917 TaxID=3155187 RepID=UPI0034208ECB
MEFAEFELIVLRAREERAVHVVPGVFTPFDFWRASEVELARAEDALGVRLPQKYRRSC